MPARQWPASRDDLTRCVVTNRLELPDAANLFEVANMHAGIKHHPANAGACQIHSQARGHAIEIRWPNRACNGLFALLELLDFFLRCLSKNHAKNGSNSIDPGIAQINKYGLTLEADCTIILSLFFSSVVHLPPFRCFIKRGHAPRICTSSLTKRFFSRVLLSTIKQNHSGALPIFA